MITLSILSSLFLLLVRASDASNKAVIRVTLKPERNDHGGMRTIYYTTSPETLYSTLVQRLCDTMKTSGIQSASINPLNIDGVEHKDLDSMKLNEIIEKIEANSNDLTMTYKIPGNQGGVEGSKNQSNTNGTQIPRINYENHYVEINGNDRGVRTTERCDGVQMCCLCISMVFVVVIVSLLYFYKVITI